MRNKCHMPDPSRDRKGAVPARRILPRGQATSLFRCALLAAALVSAAAAATVVKPSTLKVIPQPVSVEMRPSSFHLRPGMSIVVTAGKPEARQVGDYLANGVAAPTGWKWKISESTKLSGRANAIALVLTQADNHPEGYDLTITAHGVRIQASTGAGLFYGVQTLLQLLPPEIESATLQHAAWSVPCLHVADYPRFAWRGLMLDVSRHFFPKNFVKRYIDRMARAKLNLFHCSLSSAPGARRASAAGAKANPLRTAKLPPTAASTRKTTSAKWWPMPGIASSPCFPRSKCPAIRWPRWPLIPSFPAPADPSTSIPAPASTPKSITPSARAMKKPSSSSTRSSPKSLNCFRRNMFISGATSVTKASGRPARSASAAWPKSTSPMKRNCRAN